PADSPALAGAEVQFSAFLLTLGTRQAAAEAEPLLRECLSIRERALPDDQPQVWLRHNTKSLLGAALMLQDRFAEAEPLLLGGYNGMKDDPRVPPPGPATGGADRKREALERIVKLYEAWHAAEPGKGHDAQAAEWRAKLEEYRATTEPAGTPAATQPAGTETAIQPASSTP
ncbi:MAG TPA: tetratricopeptide repeat protein, partial [Phycisphaerae bacterium]